MFMDLQLLINDMIDAIFSSIGGHADRMMLGKQKYKNYLYTLVLLGYQLDLIHQVLLEYPSKQNKGINKQRDTKAKQHFNSVN